MKKTFSKAGKSVFALALAAVLAVPTVAIVTRPSSVAADDDSDVPTPIAVYDFDESESMTFNQEAVDNPAKIVEEGDYGKVIKLDNSTRVDVYDEDAPVTMWAVDYDKMADDEKGKIDEANSNIGEPDPVSGAVLTVFPKNKNKTYNVNSSVELVNPFAGKTELVGDPVGVGPNSEPIWEEGVSISYWMKTNAKGTEEEAESPLLSFNREKEDMVHKDDRDKINLAKLYYADKTNPLFEFESKKMSLADFQKEYPDVAVGNWTGPLQSGLERTILTKYAVFAGMNENFPSGAYYIEESSDGTKALTRINSNAKIDLSKFVDVTAEGSLARYGTEKGCMTFLASGGYVFTETGLINPVYKGGKEYKVEKESERQFQRNTLHAYTYLAAGNDKEFLPVVDENLDPTEALIESEAWHYMTYVIKNDSISLYVDGVLQDEDMFTNTQSQMTLVVGESFNKGWGYHNSASDAFIPDIVGENGGEKIYQQQEGYLIEGQSGKDKEENIIKDENGNKVIGYNGNCNADTLMEYITDENTKLFVGEDGPSEASTLMESKFGSKADTYVGKMSFYDIPLTADQAKAAYDDAVRRLGEEPSASPVNSQSPDVSTSPIVSQSPDVSETPDVSTSPIISPSPVQGLKGDVNLDGKVNINDFTLCLRAALNIQQLTGQALANADINDDGKLNINDATALLKLALNIKD